VDKSHFSSSIPLLAADLPRQLILLNTSANIDFEPNGFFNDRKRQIQRRLGFRRSHLFKLGHDSISDVTEYLDLGRKRDRSRTIIEGYFGDFGFYDSVEPQFQKLQLGKMSPFYLEMVAKMGEYNYCSVHHRLGDFLELANSVGLLGKQYYRESFEIAEKSGCERFLIFSNDPTNSKEIFQNWGFDLSSMMWVDSIFLSSPFENLLLMGQANVLITSNSTFSFWGGKLAHERCRTIVYPKVFRKDNFTEILNIPSGWVPIDSHWQQD
jgi:hypothetical protein